MREIVDSSNYLYIFCWCWGFPLLTRHTRSPHNREKGDQFAKFELNCISSMNGGEFEAFESIPSVVFVLPSSKTLLLAIIFYIYFHLQNKQKLILMGKKIFVRWWLVERGGENWFGDCRVFKVDERPTIDDLTVKLLQIFFCFYVLLLFWLVSFHESNVNFSDDRYLLTKKKLTVHRMGAKNVWLVFQI